MEPEADSGWRRIPAWILEGLIRGLPFSILCVWVGSIGGFAIAAGLQMALAAAEQRIRRVALPLRWISLPLVFAPLIAFGLIGFVAQVGYMAAASSGSLQGFQVALESVRSFESWGSWSALLLIGGALLCLSGTRIRLLPSLSAVKVTGGFLLTSILLAWWNPAWLDAMILAVGVAAGIGADFVEAFVEWAIRRSEGRSDSLDQVSEELSFAIRAGCPAWTSPDDYIAAFEERLDDLEREVQALQGDLAREAESSPEDD